ncbi:MAG: hypothetical protein ACK56F_05765, partial [bacterium]
NQPWNCLRQPLPPTIQDRQGDPLRPAKLRGVPGPLVKPPKPFDPLRLQLLPLQSRHRAHPPDLEPGVKPRKPVRVRGRSRVVVVGAYP